MQKHLTAWLSIGSTYTYLTPLRIQPLIAQHKLDITVKPFSVRAIMKEMDNTPFPPSKPEKVRYMWRDIERRSERYGLPRPTVPAPYPLKDFDLANRVGVVMAERGLYFDYYQQTYSLWFLHGLEAGGEPNLTQTCKALGLDIEDILTTANSPATEQAYQANTAAARQSGVFGAPSFTVGEEVFWGDDRLEDAIAFLAKD